MILGGINYSFKNGQKWTFFQEVSSWIMSKNRSFSYRRFSQKFYEKTTFLMLWKEKNDFKLKNLKFKQGPKSGYFLKGLAHGFCPKINISIITVFH